MKFNQLFQSIRPPTFTYQYIYMISIHCYMLRLLAAIIRKPKQNSKLTELCPGVWRYDILYHNNITRFLHMQAYNIVFNVQLILTKYWMYSGEWASPVTLRFKAYFLILLLEHLPKQNSWTVMLFKLICEWSCIVQRSVPFCFGSSILTLHILSQWIYYFICTIWKF